MSVTALSEHARLEIAHAIHVGHSPSARPPLDDGEPVPGCGCPRCTGVAVGDPARARRPRSDHRLPVEEARNVSILEVAQRIGLGEPVRRGREVAVCCPFHDDDRPSLTINPDRNVWYCFPCAIGGDGLALYQRARGITFAEAVRELAR